MPVSPTTPKSPAVGHLSWESRCTLSGVVSGARVTARPQEEPRTGRELPSNRYRVVAGAGER
jgi:hypothetical protein